MKSTGKQKSIKRKKFNFIKNYIIFLSFLFLCFPERSIAQNDFRPGFIITRENETIQGEIDYRGEIRNSSFCTFRENLKSTPVQFNPGEINAYKFTDSKYYVSKKILIDEKEKDVFLEFLVNGIVNLYFFRDLNNYLYFIEGKDGELIELSNEKRKEYIEGTGYVEKNSNKFIGILKARLADCNEIQNKIDNAVLDHNSLIEITTQYHDYMCKDEKCIVYIKEAGKIVLKFAPVVGYGISSLRFDKGQFSDFKFQIGQFLFVGISTNFSFPKWNEKLSLDTEIDLFKLNFQGNYTEEQNFKTDYYTANIEVVSLKPSAAIKYTFHSEKIKPTLALGIYSNFFISVGQNNQKKSVHTDTEYFYNINDAPLATEVFGFLFQLGCDYHIFRNHTFFSNFRLYRKTLKEAGISTFVNSSELSLGFYL